MCSSVCIHHDIRTVLENDAWQESNLQEVTAIRASWDAACQQFIDCGAKLHHLVVNDENHWSCWSNNQSSQRCLAGFLISRWLLIHRGFISFDNLSPVPLSPPQRWRRHQTLCHLQDSHWFRIRRALQPVLIPQGPGAPLQERLLGPTQRPAECKPGLPGPGALSEPAPQMNHPPAVFLFFLFFVVVAGRGGRTLLCVSFFFLSPHARVKRRRWLPAELV